ncbi:MAG: DEAD/DEAH box helicase [Chloroflexi bacterium]|nr:DEAD/DEAH box helicase [Chloroflexota bacterium]
MIVLHGSWIIEPSRFYFWAERSEPGPKRKGKKPPLPPHPFAAPAEELTPALKALFGEAFRPEALATVEAWLPSAVEQPLPSPELLHLNPDLTPDADAATLARFGVPAWAVVPLDALDALLALPEPAEAIRAGAALGADVRFWSAAAKLTVAMLAGQRYVPGMAPVSDTRYRAVWQAVTDEPPEASQVSALVAAMPPVCRALRVETGRKAGRAGGAAAEVGPETLPGPRTLLGSFVGTIIDRAVRAWTGKPRRAISAAIPSSAGEAWLGALYAEDPTFGGTKSALVELYDAWRTWLEGLHAAGGLGFRICFRLESPETAVAATQRAWGIRYFLQATDDLSLLVPAEEVWQAPGASLSYLNRRFEQPQERMLAGLGLAARLCPPVEASLRLKQPEVARLTTDEAYHFLREVAPLLETSGFGVLVPPWWGKRGAASFTSRLKLKPKRKQASTAGAAPGKLTFDTLVAFDWELAMGGQPISPEEFERLADLKTPLVQVRGEWVVMDPDAIEKGIRFWEDRRNHGDATLLEALRMALDAENAEGLPVEGVEAEDWMQELLSELAAGEKMPELPAPPGFTGQLRPYQGRGVSWLWFLRRFGLGACLADDMGLGKTAETIAWLLHAREQGGAIGPALVICPTSVMGNWQREVGRFAPALRTMIHHGADRLTDEAFQAAASQNDIVISSYGLVRRDAETLGKVPWSAVIADEAQNIKNPETKQAQAVRKLPADTRVALTGTPVENRLTDLWSIMQFLNPGYLGSQAAFRKSFVLPVERYGDADASARLKKLVQPFVLRRLKTDPTIIQDLPEKNEMKVYCPLTAEQATLYEAVVKDALQKMESMEEGIERRGIVLAMLMKLKQVCNHPAHFLKDGSALGGRSGKLERLTEMLDEVVSVGDRALVFTQFFEMGDLLRQHLGENLGGGVQFLHGGTPQKHRERMIAAFQEEADGPQIFLLSLKAGGTGLNLTRANHVFHFDRWWNPAVENQATDRAFRIGQRRDVQVHKFVCSGTLEERIDDLIESKKALAENVLGAGEQWLTEMSTDQLRDLLVLRRDAVAE